MDRIEIHSHSEYSNIRLLDCINKPEKLVDRALELGLKGIALTDHECLSGHVKLNKYAEAIKKRDDSFKIMLGNEIYLCKDRSSNQRYYHFILIAKNFNGHKALRELSTNAWLNSFYDRGMERIVTTYDDLAAVLKKYPNSLIGTTACLGGELSTQTLNLIKAESKQDIEEAEKSHNAIVNFILYCKDIFGDDFYIECAPGCSKEQIQVNQRLVSIAHCFNLKMVIGTDAHYLTKEDRFIHKAYLNSKNGDREVDSFYEYAYLQSNEEIFENLAASNFDRMFIEEMFNNSMEIYDKVENYSLFHKQTIPKVDVKFYEKKENSCLSNKYPILDSMFQSDDVIERYWVNECVNKLIELGKNNDTYYKELEDEAEIKRYIGEKLETNMFSYPVTLQHYVNLFWECGSTVGAGRGSSCAGLNHYLLDITQLDPVKWDLPFFRYLNKERSELGDIDIDLAPSKRPLILKKIKEERCLKFIESIKGKAREELGCTLIATFGTEGTKSAILTACRGYRSEDYPDGIDVDTAQYMAALIPVERGFLWSFNDVIYGNSDKDRKPISTFINEVNKYDGLLDIMIAIDGLINKRSSHASGVIMFDEDPYQFGCFMKTPKGEVITQYDLHDAEAAGMTKYDFLVTDVQDKLVECIKLLQKNNEIEKDLTLHQIYDKYFHPEAMPLDDKEVWDAIQNVKVLNLFQFDSDVGSQAAKKIKPKNIFELSDANGLMRLMTAEKGAETPMEKYIRYKANLNLWYKEMEEYGLSDKEVKTVEPYFKSSYGVPPSQEQLMKMLMDKDICDFTLGEANAARKIVGKKLMSKIPELKEKVFNQAKSNNLGKYIWNCGIATQLGYSFSCIHSMAYSMIGFQTAYISTKWNPIYWNTACLIVNSGSLEDNSEETIVSIFEPEAEGIANGETFIDLPNRKEKIKKTSTTDYGKMAKALGDTIAKGIKISLVDINNSGLGFEPDAKNNQILFGLKGVAKVNNETVDKIIDGRPYLSIADFIRRCPLNKSIMISLIKAGAFDNIDKEWASKFDNNIRKVIMAYYIMNISKPKKRITLQNFNGLIQAKLIPNELKYYEKLFFFNKYLKNNKNDNIYKLDDVAYDFFKKKYDEDNLFVSQYGLSIEQKVWDKIYSSEMDYVRNWMQENQEELLNNINTIAFKTLWDECACGTISAWEMESLCFYYHEHELTHINKELYGIKNYFDMPETPIVEDVFKKNGKEIPIFKTYVICGTVISKNDTKSSVSLLTTDGVVSVKFSKEYYAHYNRQISEKMEDGTKKVIERGWLTKGNKIMVTGFRRDDTFVAKSYKRTATHQLYLITKVDGSKIEVTHDRAGE